MKASRAIRRIGIVAVLACGCAQSESIERVLPPRPLSESPDLAPRSTWTRTFTGNRLGALEFTGTLEFTAPNRFAESRRFALVELDHTIAFDGERFTRTDAAGAHELFGSDARAVFDRCLEEALIRRQYETEPSLAVRALEGIRELEGRPARAFEVAHGSSGFRRILYFADDTQSLLGSSGRRWNGGTAPVETLLRYSNHKLLEGMELPFRVEVVEEGRLVETIEFEWPAPNAANPSSPGSAPPTRDP